MTSWEKPCGDHLPWSGDGSPPPAPYPEDACGACGWSKAWHINAPIQAAKELAEAKRAYAEAFLLYRNTGAASTDKQAEAMAEIDHGEKVLLAQARFEQAVRGL